VRGEAESIAVGGDKAMQGSENGGHVQKAAASCFLLQARWGHCVRFDSAGFSRSPKLGKAGSRTAGLWFFLWPQRKNSYLIFLANARLFMRNGTRCFYFGCKIWLPTRAGLTIMHSNSGAALKSHRHEACVPE